MNRRISRALQIVERGIVPYQPRPIQEVPQDITQYDQPPAPVERYAPTVPVLDLPRLCALHDKPFVSRYIQGQRGYEYAQSIRITDSLYQGQYADNQQTQHFDSSHVQHEHCPWCGSYNDRWKGPVHCTSCNRFCCYGTTLRDYFRCPCGNEGKLHGSLWNQRGVVPSYRNFGIGGA